MIVYGSEIALKIKTQVKAEIDEIKLANKFSVLKNIN